MTLLTLQSILEQKPTRYPRLCVTGFQGACRYYHYGLQGLDDKGWGCGYRTLQTVLSWFQQTCVPTLIIPDIHTIQRILCDIGDKPAQFYRSHEWIGTVECGYVIEKLADVHFRLIHLSKGLFTASHVNAIIEHFQQMGSPIMMGGRMDGASKGILAIACGAHRTEILIADPHYCASEEPPLSQLCSEGWIRWCDILEFTDLFYNLCLPVNKAIVNEHILKQ
ncbi:hypothetical protein AHF37_07867 [Paragonimus kellicotti]|nr:hypothetical protein AHF37_07867 [Paragonimus kellicotti]